MVQTHLESQRLSLKLADKDDADTVLSVFKSVLDSHGEATVTNTTLRDESDNMNGFDYYLRINFDFVSDDIIVIELLRDEIKDELQSKNIDFNKL